MSEQNQGFVSFPVEPPTKRPSIPLGVQGVQALPESFEEEKRKTRRHIKPLLKARKTTGPPTITFGLDFTLFRLDILCDRFHPLYDIHTFRQLLTDLHLPVYHLNNSEYVEFNQFRFAFYAVGRIGRPDFAGPKSPLRVTNPYTPFRDLYTQHGLTHHDLRRELPAILREWFWTLRVKTDTIDKHIIQGIEKAKRDLSVALAATAPKSIHDEIDKRVREYVRYRFGEHPPADPADDLYPGTGSDSDPDLGPALDNTAPHTGEDQTPPPSSR